MFEDGRNFVERRLTPRIKMTVRRHIQYWVAMSPARRVVASLALAAAIGGTTFGACRASDVTGPNFKSQQRSVSSSLIGTSDGLISDSDSDSDNWRLAPSEHRKRGDDDVKNDPDFNNTVETVFPITEAVYNTCRNELPVLNGYLKTRMHLHTEPLGSTHFKLQEWKDTRGVYGTVTVQEEWDHDDDSDTPKEWRTRTIRYHNRETLLDEFKAGPIDGLPFRSVFVAKMHLEREGPDPYYVKQYGDDLFVFFEQTVKVDQYGKTRTETKTRTECK